MFVFWIVTFATCKLTSRYQFFSGTYWFFIYKFSPEHGGNMSLWSSDIYLKVQVTTQKTNIEKRWIIKLVLVYFLPKSGTSLCAAQLVSLALPTGVRVISKTNWTSCAGNEDEMCLPLQQTSSSSLRGWNSPPLYSEMKTKGRQTAAKGWRRDGGGLKMVDLNSVKAT